MKISLSRTPSTDALGIKRWRFALQNEATLTVFERPYAYADTPLLLRLDHADGRMIDMRLASFRSQAVDKAEWLAWRWESGVYANQGEFGGLDWEGPFSGPDAPAAEARQ